MNEIVRAAIAADIALLTREVETPAGELGYGVDLSCIDDITEDLQEVDAFSPIGIAQAALRRLTTPRGSMPDDEDYGIDLRSFVNRGVTVSELRDLERKIRSELAKDDRIASSEVAVTLASLRELSVMVKIVPANPALGAFSMTLAVTTAAALLEAIG